MALDGKTYGVDPTMCIIADAGGERPIGLGGVMGGVSTGCSDETTDVFLESAWFDPLVTAQTGRSLTINSDAQYRFARGVDPVSLTPGLELATRLILDLCGGEPSGIVFVGEPPASPAPFAFDPAYVKQLSGMDLPEDRIGTILGQLGFLVQAAPVDAAGPWIVTPPSWRRDLTREIDLVEEVARIHGYEQIPEDALVPMARSARTNVDRVLAEVRATLTAMRTVVEQDPTGHPAVTGARSIVVFQPHLYSRTRTFAREFAEALEGADEVFVLDVYAAREQPLAGVSGATIAGHIGVPVHYVPDFSAVAARVASVARPGDVVVTMGAGDVTLLGPEIIAALRANADRGSSGD
jgi:hypothetical protein